MLLKHGRLAWTFTLRTRPWFGAHPAHGHRTASNLPKNGGCATGRAVCQRNRTADFEKHVKPETRHRLR